MKKKTEEKEKKQKLASISGFSRKSARIFCRFVPKKFRKLILFSANTEQSGLISIERDVNSNVFDVGSRRRIDFIRRIIASI